jgi:hypothetical protein
MSLRLLTLIFHQDESQAIYPCSIRVRVVYLRYTATATLARVCFVLFCFVLFCFVLFCFVLFCFVLYIYDILLIQHSPAIPDNQRKHILIYVSYPNFPRWHGRSVVFTHQSLKTKTTPPCFHIKFTNAVLNVNFLTSHSARSRIIRIGSVGVRLMIACLAAVMRTVCWKLWFLLLV